MPKRAERDLYPNAFNGKNPYANYTLEEMYKSIQWDKNPDNLYPIESPEPLASLGTVAKLVLEENEYKYSEKESPFLAVGKDTNLLYIIPKLKGKPLDFIPEFNIDTWSFIGDVKSTHYYSYKGEENGYYYHDHESPFPGLFIDTFSGVGIILPADNNGKPSYAVIKEGIIG